MPKINWGIGPGSIANAFSYSIENATNSKLISVFGRSYKTNSFAEKFNIDAYHQLDDFCTTGPRRYLYCNPIANIFYALEGIKIESMSFAKSHLR